MGKQEDEINDYVKVLMELERGSNKLLYQMALENAERRSELRKQGFILDEDHGRNQEKILRMRRTMAAYKHLQEEGGLANKTEDELVKLVVHYSTVAPSIACEALALIKTKRGLINAYSIGGLEETLKKSIKFKYNMILDQEMRQRSLSEKIIYYLFGSYERDKLR